MWRGRAQGVSLPQNASGALLSLLLVSADFYSILAWRSPNLLLGIERPTSERARQNIHAVHAEQLQNAPYGEQLFHWMLLSGKGASSRKVSINFSRVTGGPIVSRLWMRLLALSVEKMVILLTNVQRWKFTAIWSKWTLLALNHLYQSQGHLAFLSNNQSKWTCQAEFPLWPCLIVIWSLKQPSTTKPSSIPIWFTTITYSSPTILSLAVVNCCLAFTIVVVKSSDANKPNVIVSPFVIIHRPIFVAVDRTRGVVF